MKPVQSTPQHTVKPRFWAIQQATHLERHRIKVLESQRADLTSSLDCPNSVYPDMYTRLLDLK